MAKTATRRSAATGRRDRNAPRRKPARGRKPAGGKAARYWSSRVTKESDALDLEGGVFRLKNPKRIAASLKRSAEESRRRKGGTLRLRALDPRLLYQPRRQEAAASRRRTLERAKSGTAPAVRRSSRASRQPESRFSQIFQTGRRPRARSAGLDQERRPMPPPGSGWRPSISAQRAALQHFLSGSGIRSGTIEAVPLGEFALAPLQPLLRFPDAVSPPRDGRRNRVRQPGRFLRHDPHPFSLSGHNHGGN